MSHRIAAGEGSWASANVAGVLRKDLAVFPEGTAKLIRLMPGAAYPRHKHPARTEYAYVVAGRPRLSVADEAHDVAPGDCVVFPTDTLHALENPGPEEALLLVGAIYHHAASQPPAAT